MSKTNESDDSPEHFFVLANDQDGIDTVFDIAAATIRRARYLCENTNAELERREKETKERLKGEFDLLKQKLEEQYGSRSVMEKIGRKVLDMQKHDPNELARIVTTLCPQEFQAEMEIGK